MTQRSDIRRVEGKLKQVLAQANCAVCAARVGNCPSCGNPIGATAAEAAHAFAKLHRHLDAIGQRLRLVDSMVDSIDSEDEE